MRACVCTYKYAFMYVCMYIHVCSDLYQKEYTKEFIEISLLAYKIGDRLPHKSLASFQNISDTDFISEVSQLTKAVRHCRNVNQVSCEVNNV